MVQRLLQPAFLRPEVGQMIGHVRSQRDLGRLRGGVRLAHAIPYHATDVDPVRGKVEAPRLDARHVEDGVDQSEQLAAGRR